MHEAAGDWAAVTAAAARLEQALLVWFGLSLGLQLGLGLRLEMELELELGLGLGLGLGPVPGLGRVELRLQEVEGRELAVGTWHGRPRLIVAGLAMQLGGWTS